MQKLGGEGEVQLQLGSEKEESLGSEMKGLKTTWFGQFPLKLSL